MLTDITECMHQLGSSTIVKLKTRNYAQRSHGIDFGIYLHMRIAHAMKTDQNKNQKQIRIGGASSSEETFSLNLVAFSDGDVCIFRKCA